jgi:hypothetical protein
LVWSESFSTGTWKPSWAMLASSSSNDREGALGCG